MSRGFSAESNSRTLSANPRLASALHQIQVDSRRVISMLAPENNGYHKQYKMLAYEHTLAPELFSGPN